MLGLHQLWEVHGNWASLNTNLLEAMLGIVKLMSGVEQSLGWDATNVEAGATEGTSLFDAHRFEASLASLDGCDVTCYEKIIRGESNGSYLPPGPPPMMARSYSGVAAKFLRPSETILYCLNNDLVSIFVWILFYYKIKIN